MNNADANASKSRRNNKGKEKFLFLAFVSALFTFTHAFLALVSVNMCVGSFKGQFTLEAQHRGRCKKKEIFLFLAPAFARYFLIY